MREVREHNAIAQSEKERRKVEAIDELNKYLFHKPKDSHIPFNVLRDFVKYG